MMKKNSLRKNFIWNLVGTTFNAFNSLFYMIIVTRINGIKNAGIFSIAFATACILYIIGIYAGRIYQVTENDKKITDKEETIKANSNKEKESKVIKTLDSFFEYKYYLLSNWIYLDHTLNSKS